MGWIKTQKTKRSQGLSDIDESTLDTAAKYMGVHIVRFREVGQERASLFLGEKVHTIDLTLEEMRGLCEIIWKIVGYPTGDTFDPESET